MKKDNKKNKKKTKKVKNNGGTLTLIVTVLAILVVLGLIAFVVNTFIQKERFHADNPIATITIKDMGEIKVELYPDYAPNTVSNFIALANNNFYDGKTFHRTIPDFMIQGGDPNGDGTGNATLRDLGEESDEAYSIPGEFIINGFRDNKLKHTRGVISMARSDYSSIPGIAKKGYDSASCQFFICTTDNSSLDGVYAPFGKVLEGIEIVDQISNVEVETRDSDDENLTADKPINPPVIESIRVETFGIDYGIPDTLEPFDYTTYMMQHYYGGTSAY